MNYAVFPLHLCSLLRRCAGTAVLILLLSVYPAGRAAAQPLLPLRSDDGGLAESQLLLLQPQAVLARGWTAPSALQQRRAAALFRGLADTTDSVPSWRGIHFLFGDSTDHLRHNLVTLGVTSASLWVFLWALPDDFPRFYTKNPRISAFKTAYTRPPIWNDRDWWFWNWIAHPLVGMQEYLMERNWGESPLHSFLFTTAASIAWEYGLEAWIERPGAFDLLITSPAGAVLGEGAYQLTRLLRRNGFTLAEKLIVVLVNPLYVLQHGYR